MILSQELLVISVRSGSFTLRGIESQVAGIDLRLLNVACHPTSELGSFNFKIAFMEAGTYYVSGMTLF